MGNEQQKNENKPDINTIYRGMFAPKTDSKDLFYDITIDTFGSGELDHKHIQEIRDAHQEADSIEIDVPEGFTEDEVSVIVFASYFSRMRMDFAFSDMMDIGKSTKSTLPAIVKDPVVMAQTSFIENVLTNDVRGSMQIVRKQLPGARKDAKSLIESIRKGSYSKTRQYLEESQKTLLGFAKNLSLDNGGYSDFVIQMLQKTNTLLSKEVFRGTTADKGVENVDDWIRISGLMQEINSEKQQEETEIAKYYNEKFIDSAAGGIPSEDEKFTDMLLDHYARRAFFTECQRHLAISKEFGADVAEATQAGRNRSLSLCERAVLKDKKAFFEKYKEVLRNTDGFKKQLERVNRKKKYKNAEGIFTADTGIGGFGMINSSVNLFEKRMKLDVIQNFDMLDKNDARVKEVFDSLKNYPPINEDFLSDDADTADISKRLSDYDSLIEYLNNHEEVVLSKPGIAGPDEFKLIENIQKTVKRYKGKLEKLIPDIEVSKTFAKDLDIPRTVNTPENEKLEQFMKQFSADTIKLLSLNTDTGDPNKDREMQEYKKRISEMRSQFRSDMNELISEPDVERAKMIGDRYNEIMSLTNEWREKLGKDYFRWNYSAVRDINNEYFSKSEIVNGIKKIKEISARQIDFNEFYKPESPVSLSNDENERLLEQAAIVIALDNSSYSSFAGDNKEKEYQRICKEVLDGTCYSIRYLKNLPDDVRMLTAKKALSENKDNRYSVRESASLLQSYDKEMTAYNSNNDSAVAMFGAESIEDGSFYYGFAKSGREGLKEKDKGLYDKILKADEESKKIKLEIPEGLSKDDAALLVLSELSSDEIMGKYCVESAQYGGTTIPKMSENVAMGGMVLFVENIIKNDERVNVHALREFLPEARTNANYAMAEYKKGNLKPMAESLKHSLSEYIKEGRAGLDSGSPINQFCVHTAKRIKDFLERDDFKAYFEKNGGLLSKEDAEWMQKFDMDKQVADELNSWKLEIDKYARTQMSKNPFADPAKDTKYQSMIMEYAARKYYFEEKRSFITGVRNNEDLFENKIKAARNREMSQNERNMMKDKQVYIGELKSVISQSKELQKTLQKNNTWIKAVSAVKEPLNISVRSITPEMQNAISTEIDKKFKWTDIEKSVDSNKEERNRLMDETLGREEPANTLAASKKLFEKYVKEMMPKSMLKDKKLVRILSTYKNINSYSGTAEDNKKIDKLYSYLDKYQSDLSAKMLDDDSPELIQKTEAVTNIMMYIDNIKEAAVQKPVAAENELPKIAVDAINAEQKKIAEQNQQMEMNNAKPGPEKIKDENIIENPVNSSPNLM